MKYKYLKGSENDFKGAPEWATECVWTDKGGDSFCYWLNPETKTIFNPGFHTKPCGWGEEYGHRNYIKAERQPITEPSWDGVGLPPVGAKVEWMSDKYGWLGGTIAAYDEKYPSIAIIRHNDGYIGCNRGEIRTEADKKRDVAITEIVDAIVAPRPKGNGGILSQAVSVYNKIAAGKIPGVKLED